MNILEKLLQFTQAEGGEASSRRLTFIASSVIFSLGSLLFVAFLIRKGEYKTAAEFWEMFGWFTGFSGGFVTADLLTKLRRK